MLANENRSDVAEKDIQAEQYKHLDKSTRGRKIEVWVWSKKTKFKKKLKEFGRWWR